MEEVRKLLAEWFDVGYAVVSWQDGKETMYDSLQFGNQFALRGLANDCDVILCLDDGGMDDFPVDDDDNDDRLKKEEA